VIPRDQPARGARSCSPEFLRNSAGGSFEKFSQADASATREKGGTGLGLHIVRRFIEHMHGRIGFDSEVGAGSTFWTELPAAHVNVAPGQPPDPTGQNQSFEFRARSR